MHIYYITQRDVLKGRVGSIMVMQSCRAFARAGEEVTLVAPSFHRTGNVMRDDVWQHYGFAQCFRIVMLPTLLWDRAPRALNLLSKVVWHWLYSLQVLFDALRRPAGEVLVYSRDPAATFPYLCTLAAVRRWKRIRFVYELHSWKNSHGYRVLLQNMDGIVYITESLRTIVERDIGAGRIPAAIGRMGVNLDNYTGQRAKLELRAALDLGADRFIAAYTGKVAPGMREIAMIIDAAARVPDMQVVIVGGGAGAVEFWQHHCRDLGVGNVTFTGFVPPSRVAEYQLAADALLMYYPGDWGVAAVLSPGKMMEYMATGNAIVSVDHPPLAEVLRNGENAVLVTPDAPDELARAIRTLMADPEQCHRIGARAREEARTFTWDNRAVELVQFVKDLSHTQNAEFLPDGVAQVAYGDVPVTRHGR